jgi:hypothetical protein
VSLAASAALQEAEVYRLISRCAARGGEKRVAIAAIAGHILQLHGVTGLSLELVDHAIDCERTYGDLSKLQTMAVGDLCYGGLRLGSVRIAFDPQVIELGSPVKAARFVGQQIASVLADFQQARTYAQLRKQRDTLAGRLEMRKVFSRAIAFVQSRHGLSERQARRFLFTVTKKLKKPLLYTARTIVTLESSLPLRINTKFHRIEERPSYARRSSVA